MNAILLGAVAVVALLVVGAALFWALAVRVPAL